MTAALRGIRVLDLTGIATYFWVLTNRKPTHRRGKVQLVDATQWYQFLDGNGRIGRLLITLMLCHTGMLRQPFLYLKQHRSDYCDLSNDVRRAGDWEAWLAFYLPDRRGDAVADYPRDRARTDRQAPQPAVCP